MAGSTICPETPGKNSSQPISCATAYTNYGCRCDTCREWKRGVDAERDHTTTGDGRGSHMQTALTRKRDEAIEEIGEEELYKLVEEGLSMREIATELGLDDPGSARTQSAVRSWLRRDKDRYSEAKRLSAEALAEKAGEVYGDKAPTSTADAKWRNDLSGYLRWLSEQRSGGNRGDVNISISFEERFLAQLRKSGRMPRREDEPEAIEAEIIEEDEE